jgi:KaiC/GvpD/RAD55 family RecA-like ATPase
MSKTIGLKQLAQKTYTHVEGFSEELMQSLGGKIEDAFDCVIWGASGGGKSNFTAIFIKSLVKALKCRGEYVAYEEGHGFTVQETFIRRHNMLEELGNNLMITDFLNYDELHAKMNRRKKCKGLGT